MKNLERQHAGDPKPLLPSRSGSRSSAKNQVSNQSGSRQMSIRSSVRGASKPYAVSHSPDLREKLKNGNKSKNFGYVADKKMDPKRSPSLSRSNDPRPKNRQILKTQKNSLPLKSQKTSKNKIGSFKSLKNLIPSPKLQINPNLPPIPSKLRLAKPTEQIELITDDKKYLQSGISNIHTVQKVAHTSQAEKLAKSQKKTYGSELLGPKKIRSKDLKTSRKKIAPKVPESKGVKQRSKKGQSRLNASQKERSSSASRSLGKNQSRINLKNQLKTPGGQISHAQKKLASILKIV